MVNKYSDAIKSLWVGRCDIIIRETKVNPANGRNEPTETVLTRGEPCRISFSTIKATTENSNAERITQTVKLFISKDVEIPENSKIVVTQNGITGAYVKSGAPGVYSSHNEYMLEKFEAWA